MTSPAAVRSAWRPWSRHRSGPRAMNPRSALWPRTAKVTTWWSSAWRRLDRGHHRLPVDRPRRRLAEQVEHAPPGGGDDGCGGRRCRSRRQSTDGVRSDHFAIRPLARAIARINRVGPAPDATEGPVAGPSVNCVRE